MKAVIKLNAVDLLLGKLDDSELREPALRALQEIHRLEVISGLAAKLETTGDKQLAKLICVALFRLYHREAPWDGVSWWGNRPNFAGPYFSCAAWEHTPTVKSAIQAAFRKVDPSDYAELFERMRMNQVPEDDLALDIEFDEILSFLNNKT